MRKFYLFLQMVVCFCIFFTSVSKSQCLLLDASYTTYESRCAATGAIKVNASGGSGSYKYKTVGPVNTNFTTSDSITGLSAGVYTLVVNDVVTNCTISKTNIVVAGSYQDPRFTLTKIDVSCDNSNNGSIIVDGHQFGRAPYNYSIVAPSPMGIGTTNGSGIFSGLMAGDYSIRMTDSCGGIQTRQITVVNYTWWIDSYSFTKIACDDATGFIKVVDSRGNISTVGGIPGFMYGIVRAPGDTIWSANPNFNFALLGHSTFDVIAKDNCGIIKKANVRLSLIPSASASVNTYGYSCNFFSASLRTSVNFLIPDYCLYDINDVQLVCNTTGIFTNIPYGSYCIKAHDACTDTTITRCFTVAAPPISVGNNVLISNKTCTTFTASITSPIGLTNPEYCLFDSSGVQIICNNTGIFNGLSYQPYCITTSDGCRDTTISRCFNALPPTPVVASVIIPMYITCNNFGIAVNGDSLTTPLYCLYDSIGVLIICNSTGIFDSIPLGNYCVTVHDDCYDTTITRCLSILVPVIRNDMVTVISDKTCSDFTLTVSSNNIIDPEFCLYTASGVLISCNPRGVFNNLPYGSYCIKSPVICPDTTLVSCFTVSPLLPSVGASVQTYNKTCTTFSAQIIREENITNPNYCIYNSRGVLISCNTRGAFENLPYGNYCIKITDGCYDTTITRCFGESPIKVSLSGNAVKSCSYGFAQFNLNMGGGSGFLPVNIIIYNPNGSVYSNANYNTASVFIDSIPGVPSGQTYKIVATDNCRNKDSISIGSPASYFNHSPVVIAKCPGATWANGSGNIVTTVTTNMGSLTVRIIKKNGINYSPGLSANSVSGGVYTFIDLGPGTYILSSSEHSCNNKFYDTVVITNYQYPNLDRSSAYQCDANGFSVSAVATNGVAPFSYEIIGSQPVTPSITAGPQSSPIFNINNGSNYSLIRLRALDACGNATLGDASILPLAMNGIVSSWNCIAQPATLSIDSLFNSTYFWYKKLNIGSTDSTLMGTGTSLYIPTILPSDTGIYICYVSVNSGCIKRTFYFHLNGNCWTILPVILEEFKGKTINEDNLLNWKTSIEKDIRQFIIERKNGAADFGEIGRISTAGNSAGIRLYQFTDRKPPNGKNQYRLKMRGADQSASYSNIVSLYNKIGGSAFSIYPNPVKEKFTIDFIVSKKHQYKISLLTTMSQVIKEMIFITDGTDKLEIPRPASVQKGIYILRLVDLDTNEVFKEKIIFL